MLSKMAHKEMDYTMLNPFETRVLTFFEIDVC